MQDDGDEKPESAQYRHDDIRVSILVRNDGREIAREAQDEVEREKEPRKIDADAEAQQGKKSKTGRKHAASPKRSVRDSRAASAFDYVKRLGAKFKRSRGRRLRSQQAVKAGLSTIPAAIGDLAAESPGDEGCIGENAGQ